MRAVVWIAEDTWEQCVEHARELVPDHAAMTLVHVSPSDVEALAADGPRRLMGRHPPPRHTPPVRAIAAEEAQSLLESARRRLGREAELSARRGRIEHEIVDACAGADLLVLARDGEPRIGPKSLGPRTRFVVDHAPCQVLLVWSAQPRSNIRRRS